MRFISCTVAKFCFNPAVFHHNNSMVHVGGCVHNSRFKQSDCYKTMVYVYTHTFCVCVCVSLVLHPQ